MKREVSDIINKERLEEELDGFAFGQNIYYKEEVSSTNIVAKQLAKEGIADDGFLVIAEKQTNGKGRRGRDWDSPKGSGIYMSLILKPKISLCNVSMLTLITALAVNQAVREETGLESFIKWPNDIVVNGKKICGILTEMSSEQNKIQYVVIGIGINVNAESFPNEILEKATSLFIESKQKYKRILLIKKILKQLEFYYERFLETEDMSMLIAEYNQMLINIEKQVLIQESQNSFEGIAKGINEKGELLVQTEEGIQVIMSGEVSVRGIYGYV